MFRCANVKIFANLLIKRRPTRKLINAVVVGWQERQFTETCLIWTHGARGCWWKETDGKKTNGRGIADERLLTMLIQRCSCLYAKHPFASVRKPIWSSPMLLNVAAVDECVKSLSDLSNGYSSGSASDLKSRRFGIRRLELDVWNSTFRCLWQSEIFDSLDSFWNPKIWISSVKILHIREGASQKINKLSIFRMCKAAYRLDKKKIHKRHTRGTHGRHTRAT